MIATFWDMPIGAAPDLLARVASSIAALQQIARPVGTIMGRMQFRRTAEAETLAPISTAPRGRTVQLYGPEVTFDPKEGYRETGRHLWGIGVKAETGWHIACVCPEGRHAQIWPTHWDSVSKGKL
jgi:hypothetical protein